MFGQASGHLVETFRKYFGGIEAECIINYGLRSTAIFHRLASFWLRCLANEVLGHVALLQDP